MGTQTTDVAAIIIKNKTLKQENHAVKETSHTKETTRKTVTHSHQECAASQVTAACAACVASEECAEA